MEDIKTIVANADANAKVEGMSLSKDTIDMIENCLKTDNGSFLFQLYLKSNRGYLAESETLVNSKDSKYCYSNGVLKNNMGIKNKDLLNILVSDNAAFYQTQIVSGNDNYKFSFDVNSYLNLHRKMFGSIFSFAGEIRDEKIYKSCEPYFKAKTPFCEPSYIYNYLCGTLEEMKRRLRTLNNREDLINYLAYFYGELNMIHPFREGNGRVLRTYFLLLVKEISKNLSFGNFELDYSLWSDEDREELIKSTIINSINGDISGIGYCFDKVLVDKNKRRLRS